MRTNTVSIDQRSAPESLRDAAIWPPSTTTNLAQRLQDRSARVGICGLGYVGLPLAAAAARAGFRTVGFDIDQGKIERVNAGDSYIPAIASAELAELTGAGKLSATRIAAALEACDVICICVPTPLTRHREPDLSIVVAMVETIAKHLRSGQLIVLESTTFPGTTIEVVKPILEATGLTSGIDFFLGYSPEREDPGSAFATADIPKVVAGDGPEAKAHMIAFYGSIVRRVVPVSTVDTAEVVKITENVFRFVNISLINELKIIYGAMGIDIWEVIEAAKTKPFGFMPFYPGPGLGGHCIPVDPFYLTWKAREYGLPTRFVELAGEVNQAIPQYLLGKIEQALDEHRQLSLSRASVLVVGLAYKKNVSDVRESPALKLIELLAPRVSKLACFDPHVTQESLSGHPLPKGAVLGAPHDDRPGEFDLAIIVTDHDQVDYELVERSAHVILDTRNAMEAHGVHSLKIVKA